MCVCACVRVCVCVCVCMCVCVCVCVCVCMCVDVLETWIENLRDRSETIVRASSLLLLLRSLARSLGFTNLGEIFAYVNVF